MRADPQQYALSTTGVSIRGGLYAFVATGATGNLQILAPDNSTFVNFATSDTPGTPVAAAGAAAVGPLYLPAGQVKLASGTGWLVGIG